MNTTTKLSPVKEQLRKEYTSRINKVIDYIQSHLKTKFTLAQLAAEANFSKYHFHRIFASIVGETLSSFIQRIRIEKAAALIANNPSLSLTVVLLECGFSTSAHFSRVFKERFNITPSQWRDMSSSERKIVIKNSKIRQTESNYKKELKVSLYYVDSENFQQQWRIKMTGFTDANVMIKDLPEMTVAYVRHIGPYEADEKLFESLYGKIMKWAAARDLLNFPETQMLAIYHDDPEITDKAKLRTDVCISVPADTEVDGDIGKSKIPAGKYAFARFELKSDQYGEAWNAVMGSWLPESGYQCDDRPVFELCHNNFKDHPEQKHIVDICIPIKPL